MKPHEICGVVLAAGKSSRMGRNKLTLPFERTTIGGHTLQTALDSRLDHVFLVTKEDDELEWLTDKILRSSKWSQVKCREAHLGQAYSLRCGVESARKMNALGMLVMLGDQPLIKVEMINSLLERFRIASHPPYAASTYEGRIQPPILFSSDLYPMLQKLEGDEGARSVLRNQSITNGITVDFKEGSCFYDIDTEEDYEWLTNMSRS
ncbi:nucleotidyltransferase family protein [Halobacillus campisalis]|uniref:Nucleotidyltransferase family protein n=1 Tax=Halobacillus campisalis TaxID=435909 RepID=A0ABW2K8Z0_9BACI|nr:nucleotidyltransferase family protein [Halobacillus campisalis]